MDDVRLSLVIVTLVCLTGCARRDEASPTATPSLTVATPRPEAGAPIDLRFGFAVASDAPPFTEDYRVFVHFLNARGDLLWTFDHQPPVPTTMWKPGTRVEYGLTTFVADSVRAEPIAVSVGLFSPANGARVPLSGDGAGDRSYVVARFTPREAGTRPYVTYTEGWYPPETAGEQSAEEWRWSGRTGSISFRNPGRDAVLLLEMDQPSVAVAGPQQVQVRLGDATVDTFTLQPGARELRRIPLPAAVIGSGRQADVTIRVDRTFVPAKLAGSSSTDTRELGVRVFHAYVDAR